MIEVKSTTRVKDVHLHDLAFQAFVLAGAGSKIRRCLLAHINPDFIRHGPIDPKQFFVLDDVTDRASGLSRGIVDQLDGMFQTLRLRQHPDVQIGPQCDDPYPCPLRGMCWSFLPESNVTQLYRGGAKGFKLLRDGITELKGIPEDFQLTDNQKIQRRAARTGQPHIDRPAVAAFLARLQHPVSFLDFETFSTAIPLFDRVKPFQQVPFQYSLHVQRTKDSGLEHHPFLADGMGDPRPEFLCRLRNALPGEGSVVAFNAPFERARLEECGERLAPCRSASSRTGNSELPVLAPPLPEY